MRLLAGLAATTALGVAFERRTGVLAGSMRDEPEQVALALVGDMLSVLVHDAYDPFH